MAETVGLVDGSNRAEDWLRIWQANNPIQKEAQIPLHSIHASQVVVWAQAVHGNEHVNEVTFKFAGAGDDPNILGNDDALPDAAGWDPLLREIETRRPLEKVTISGTPNATSRNLLVPLFRNRFFQALRRNENVRSIRLHEINFSDHDTTSAIFHFLDSAAASLTELQLHLCVDTSEAKHIATALQRNATIQTLSFCECRDDFVIPIFEKLAASSSNERSAPSSSLTKIRYRPPSPTTGSAPLTEALRHYLESSSATIQAFHLDSCIFFPGDDSFSGIFESLERSATVSELIFSYCIFLVVPEGGSDDEEGDENDQLQNYYVQQVANLFRNKPNLVTLRIASCNFFQIQQLSDTFCEMLVQRESPLRLFDFSLHGRDNVGRISVADLRILLAGLSKSSQLERLMVRGIAPENRPDHFQAIVQTIPLFKMKHILFDFQENATDYFAERFLEVLKTNYLVQDVLCIRQGQIFHNWFSEQNGARLQRYLDRNQKLAQWTENPALVPRDLWSYAMMLALKAGMDSLYQSLLALSGEGIGLQRKRRKRKRAMNLSITDRLDE